VRSLRIVLLAAGVLGLLVLVYHLDAGSIASALARVTWWEFVLICVVHGISIGADTLGWRFTLAGDPPPFRKLLAARCAGEAVNVLTALGSVGGEAVKAWLLRREVPYEASVPSLILAKTTLVIAQTLLLVTGLLVAWTTGIAGATLLSVMAYLLLVEVMGVGGFVAVQLGGVVRRAGRILAWADLGGLDQAKRLDQALRDFYRHHWRWLLASVGMHFAGWLVGVLEALLILRSLHLPASPITAIVIDALGSGVRFTTFFVPASLGTLEGANAAAFTVFGWAASGGLAFTLVRRGRQAVWIGLGVIILMAMGTSRSPATERAEPVASGAD
jgi:glycosyltransferase 2 family protein